jgi:hypothetical protein
VSRLATRHIQKLIWRELYRATLSGGNEASVSAGMMDFKKIENLEFLK